MCKVYRDMKCPECGAGPESITARVEVRVAIGFDATGLIDTLLTETHNVLDKARDKEDSWELECDECGHEWKRTEDN